MRQRLLKSMRIAITAVSLLVCGLLIWLWVRSFSTSQTVWWELTTEKSFRVESENGRVEVVFFDDSVRGAIPIPISYPILTTIFASIAALPLIKWRFSLRTLLIALTLFALFFGAIAMSM